jgi:hypothetical protein
LMLTAFLIAVTALLVLLVLFILVALVAPPEIPIEFAARCVLPLEAAHSGLAFVFCARMTKDTAKMRVSKLTRIPLEYRHRTRLAMTKKQNHAD